MMWQDIETAPRDGTWFDAWRDPSKASSSYWEPRITVRWDEEGKEWVWPDNTYEVFTEKGIERANAAIADCEMYADKSFTHWMPLPEAPH